MKKKTKEEAFISTHGEDMRLMIPANFSLLCNLFDIDKRKVLHDFLENVSLAITDKSDAQRKAAKEYFLECGYGQDYYSKEDIEQMFTELDAMRLVWPQFPPREVDTELLDVSVAFRDKFQRHWYNKWFSKIRRKQNDNK